MMPGSIDRVVAIALSATPAASSCKCIARQLGRALALLTSRFGLLHYYNSIGAAAGLTVHLGPHLENIVSGVYKREFFVHSPARDPGKRIIPNTLLERGSAAAAARTRSRKICAIRLVDGSVRAGDAR